MSPCFTHPQGILGVYDFLLSDESSRMLYSNKGHLLPIDAFLMPYLKWYKVFCVTSAICCTRVHERPRLFEMRLTWNVGESRRLQWGEEWSKRSQDGQFWALEVEQIPTRSKEYIALSHSCAVLLINIIIYNMCCATDKYNLHNRLKLDKKI